MITDPLELIAFCRVFVYNEKLKVAAFQKRIGNTADSRLPPSEKERTEKHLWHLQRSRSPA